MPKLKVLTQKDLQGILSKLKRKRFALDPQIFQNIGEIGIIFYEHLYEAGTKMTPQIDRPILEKKIDSNQSP